MKVNNIKVVRNIHWVILMILMICLFFSLLAGIILGNLFNKISVCMIVSIVSYWIVWKQIICFEFENSGAVISIKKYYMFQRSRSEIIEFPIEMLLDFNIESRLNYNVLSFNIQSSAKRKVKFYYIVIGLNKEKRKMLRNCFKK